MAVPIPGMVDITIIQDILLEPSMIFLIFVACGAAGLMTGKIQSDQAKAKLPGSDPTMENVTVFDWLMDYGYGVLGGILGLTIVIPLGLPVPIIIGFGFIGRIVLIKVGERAKSIIQ